MARTAGIIYVTLGVLFVVIGALSLRVGVGAHDSRMLIGAGQIVVGVVFGMLGIAYIAGRAKLKGRR
jgi:hypothetical protein